MTRSLGFQNKLYSPLANRGSRFGNATLFVIRPSDKKLLTCSRQNSSTYTHHFLYAGGGREGYKKLMFNEIVKFPRLYGFSLKSYDTKIRFKLTVNGLSFQQMGHSSRAWNQSARGLLIPGIRSWSLRKSSTTTDT
jgi:hypothetical protein